MTTPQQSDDDIYGTWEHIGRAAEDFARRVARDAGKFAERMEEHAGEFAHDIRRDWQRLQRDYRHGHRHAHHRTSAPDVRRIFEDIRTIVADVLDGVDELIDRVFTGRSDAPADDWARIVNNRDITCGQCARTIAAGEESYARHTAGATEFRCIDCGVPEPA